MNSFPKTGVISKQPPHSQTSNVGNPKAKSRPLDQSKGPHGKITSNNDAKPELTKEADSWADIVGNDGGKPFTDVDKHNSTSHRESNNQINSKPQPELKEEKPSKSNASGSYRRHTALLIHDDNFKDFDGKQFNRQFNVHTFKAGSYADLSKQSKRLNNTIKRLKPDCIYIHTGMSDFLKKKPSLLSEVKELSGHLLTTTDAQICFSALIPSSNNENLNSKLDVVNKDIRNYISRLHEDRPELKERIFTFTNDSIRGQNTYTLGTGFQLQERGQKLLYLRLREGLKKTMRLPRERHHTKTKRSTNKYSDD